VIRLDKQSSMAIYISGVQAAGRLWEAPLVRAEHAFASDLNYTSVVLD
jgi:hypothetical protein